MSKQKTYTEEFKKSIVSLYQNGKTYAQLQREYGVGLSAFRRWVAKYTTVKNDDGTIVSMNELNQIRKRLAELEEENIILKKATAIFMQESKLK